MILLFAVGERRIGVIGECLVHISQAVAISRESQPARIRGALISGVDGKLPHAGQGVLHERELVGIVPDVVKHLHG